MAVLVSADNCTRTELICSLQDGNPNILAETVDSCSLELRQKIDKIQDAVDAFDTQSIVDNLTENQDIMLKIQAEAKNRSSILPILINETCSAGTEMTMPPKAQPGKTVGLFKSSVSFGGRELRGGLRPDCSRRQ